jgi:hypothetical protein
VYFSMGKFGVSAGASQPITNSESEAYRSTNGFPGAAGTELATTEIIAGSELRWQLRAVSRIL